VAGHQSGVEELPPLDLLTARRQEWGIENGLHYRRDVTLHEDRTRMTKGNTARVMACLNNLVIGLVLTKTNYSFLPHARRYFDAFPNRAFSLITRL
jgi:hypothetical protein